MRQLRRVNQISVSGWLTVFFEKKQFWAFWTTIEEGRARGIPKISVTFRHFLSFSIQLVLLIYVDMRLTTRMMRLVIPPCLVVCYHNTSYCDFPCLPPSETAHTNTSHFFGELSTTLQINVRKITFFLLTQVAFLTWTFTSQSWTVGILGLKNTFWTFLINLQFFMLLSWWSTQLVQGANTHNIGD